MSLCRPKTKTPALLAACRANARKGTGPRTPEGKCRSRLNALKHGRYSPNFRESLAQAGREMGVKRFDFIRHHLLKFLPPVTQEQKRKAEELSRFVWCWAERQEKALGTKQRSSMDSVNYHIATLSISRLPICDQNGRTLVTVTLGYQSRRTGAGRRLARVALTLTPGKGSGVYQEQQEMWRAAWVVAQMPVLMTGARPTPKAFKELEQAIATHARTSPPVTWWRPEVTIRLRPVRYCEPVPCRRRRKATVVSGPRGGTKEGPKVVPKVGWLQKLLGFFRRRRAEPERPKPPGPSASGSDGEAVRPPALDGPPLSRGYAYGKDSCRVLGDVECFITLVAARTRGRLTIDD